MQALNKADCILQVVTFNLLIKEALFDGRMYFSKGQTQFEHIWQFSGTGALCFPRLKVAKQC